MDWIGPNGLNRIWIGPNALNQTECIESDQNGLNQIQIWNLKLPMLGSLRLKIVEIEIWLEIDQKVNGIDQIVNDHLLGQLTWNLPTNLTTNSD